VLEAIDLGGEANFGKRLTVLRAIDKLDRLGLTGVRALLGEGRKDESGDFTKGAGLTNAQAERVLKLSIATGGVSTQIEAGTYPGDVKDDEDKDYNLLDNLLSYFSDSAIGTEGVRELEEIAKNIRASGYENDRIRIDPSVVRGLEYYTGPVFEVELTFAVEGDDGKPVRFGSVAGGGRYDGLVGRFRSEAVPATGISIGVSRLMAALQHLKKIDTQPEPGPVVVTVFDQSKIADYQRFVKQLRDAPLNKEDPDGPKIRAELYLGSGKLGAQTKYADKRRSPCTLVQGPDEAANRQVQINDLILGASISQIKDRDEYLRKKAEAQRAVSEDQLVDEVRNLLAKHGVAWS
jgi:histidyl-tRNA synthetase